MRVVVVNQHTNNFGDDAAGVALLQLLLNAGRASSISIIYNGSGEGLPVVDQRVTRVQGVELRDIGPFWLSLYFFFLGPLRLPSGSPHLERFRTIIRGADVVLVAPSGANIGVYRDWRFLSRLVMVVMEGGVPVFHWNSIGASGCKTFDSIAKRVLRRSRIYVREAASSEYLTTLGLSSELGPDTAFALAPVVEKIRADVLSFIPSELESWHPFFKRSGVNNRILGEIIPIMAGFARREQLKIEILPHTRLAAEARFNVSVRDALRLQDAEAEVVDWIESVFDYDRAIATSRAVIGGRYHAIVLAIKNGRPFVSLAYESKMLEVCHYSRTPHQSLNMLEFDQLIDFLPDALARMISDEAVLSGELRQKVDHELVPQLLRPLRAVGLAN